MNFEYDMIDSFDDSGQKMPAILSHNALVIDCSYLHKDLYEMIFDMSVVLQEHNYGLFVLARSRLNQILVSVRDDLRVCEYVPELDIVIKNQMQVYM